jgi:hypothetical protein
MLKVQLSLIWILFAILTIILTVSLFSLLVTASLTDKLSTDLLEVVVLLKLKKTMSESKVRKKLQ